MLQTPEWRNGWDEATARTECEEYILGTESTKNCLEVNGVDIEEAIETCVFDIMVNTLGRC